jgi:hypothetical protein
MTDFADDEKATNKKRSKATARRMLYDGVIRQLMSSMAGRLWMWEQLSKCHMFENVSHFDGEGHVQKTYFALGERNVGIQLLADVMRLCPREYVLAMEENTKLEKDSGKRTRTSSDGDSDDGGDTADDTPSDD